MEIKYDITESELTNDDKDLIKGCFKIDDTELNNTLQKISKAAFMEYLKMIKDKGIPTRADEVMQERLYFLLIYFFENKIPSENELCSIFHLTSSQSKTLLRNIKSKYSTKIKSFIEKTQKEIVKSAKQKEDYNWSFICQSSLVIEELNMIINQKEPRFISIKKEKGTLCAYYCDNDSYELLKKELSI